MSFLQLRPYIHGVMKKQFQYVGFWVDKGVNVNDSDIAPINQQEPIKLKVMDSPEVTREFNKKKVKLYNTDGKSSFKYYYDGDAGYSFKVKCLISRNDKLPDDKTVYYYLNKFYTDNINVSVVIDTEVVPNGVYAISEISNITLVRKDYYEIEIEFTKYTQLSQKLTNKCTILQSRLKSCKYPSKKTTKKAYTLKKINKASTKEKKKMQVGKCLQYVNEILYKKGFYAKGANPKKTKKIKTSKGKTKSVKLTRKYYYNTYKTYWSVLSKRALKRFQKKWNKQGLKPELNEKGRLDKKTWKALKKYTELK